MGERLQLPTEAVFISGVRPFRNVANRGRIFAMLT